ncbi:MAG: hypothetical protein CMN21_04140 [Rubinisphaera sp.]|nr:hypothetical protein [Rubinisphaera sp.]
MKEPDETRFHHLLIFRISRNLIQIGKSELFQPLAGTIKIAFVLNGIFSIRCTPSKLEKSIINYGLAQNCL